MITSLLIFITLIGTMILPFIFNPSEASTVTLKTMYVKITQVSIVDELDGGKYNFYVGVKWERIYDEYGKEFKADENYEDGVGDFWDVDYEDYIDDWSMVGGVIESWYDDVYTEDCYTYDISESGYQMWLFCKLDKK